MAAAAEYTKVAQELYLSYFGRPADSSGLTNMTAALAAANAPTTTAALDAAYKTNATIRALVDSFGTSAESVALYNGTAATTNSFITAIYKNLFNREPDAAGLTFWANAVDSGNLTKAAAAHSILTGALTANLTDAALINKKVTIASNFTTAIDTAAEINAYSGNAAAQTARTLLGTVTVNTDPVVFQTSINTTLNNLVNAQNPGSTFALGLLPDALVGTASNDTFVASIFNNSNSLQSGDRIDGGAGTDTLRADIGNSQLFALRAETINVENVVIRAQAVSTDSTDNNTSRTSEVQIDADSMQGVLRWENSNSRADLLIEDVRILDNQITRDITVAMVSTDPGNVDFGLYFDQHSLRAAPVATSGATLRLQLMDTRANESTAGVTPLLNNPYNGFQFDFNGVAVRVASEAIDQATTYPQLLAAIQAAVANTPGIQNFVVSLGANFTAADTQTGTLLTGREIVLTNPGSGVIALNPLTSGWLANAPVPPDSGLHTRILTAPADTTAFKITSTVILDDVGRGSTGGDLVIGGLSIGDTSTSTGVERFEITVERNSKLQTINSTNNDLEEVTIVNGAVKGNLSVLGNANLASTGGTPGVPGFPAPGTGTDAALPGVDTKNGGSQHGDAYGFHDVRLIDASAMTGSVQFSAVITDRAYAKYITQVDTQAGPATDNINFVYSGGANNDIITVDINSDILSSRSHLLSGLEDFTFTVNGGAGNDQLTVRAVGSDVNTSAWLANQDLNNNIVINGGAGDDTIRKLGAGDTRIDAGAGNDTVYAENTGFQTVQVLTNANVPPVAANVTGHYVFNTNDQASAAAAGVRNISNLQSDFNDSYNLIGTKVNVSFKGIASTVSTGNTLLGATATDLEINQAIKAAINNDAVLSKLLVAEDGPANTLIVRSLIDGVLTTAELAVSLTAPTLASLTAAQVTAASAAYGLTGANATAANVLAAVNTSIAAFGVNADYVTALAGDNTGTAITGGAGFAVSDNIIAAGTGNDVVVLGTTLGGTTAVSNNDTVVFGNLFGNDTIVNFNFEGFGIDHLDFTALGGTTVGAVTVDKSITVQAINTTATGNDTLAKIAALYNANNAAAQTHVLAVVDATGNAASIYSIADAVGANTAVATLQGTIDLANVLWSSLSQANFVDSSAVNYHLLEGASGFTAPTPVTTTAVAVTAASVAAAPANTFNAATANNIYTFTTTPDIATDVTITGYAALDGLRFANGTALTFTDTTAGDGIIDIAITDGVNSTILHLTGVAGAGDVGGINSVAGFNAAFGAGSLIIG